MNFNGERLTEARELRGLTKIALADLSEISRLSISQYEKGEQKPRPDIVDKLALKLSVPYEYFFDSTSGVEVNTVFFRSFSSATKIERKRSEIKLKWLKEISLWLSDNIEFPEFSVPDFGITEENYTLIKHEEINSIVDKLKSEWNIPDGPIANLTNLLESHGVIISAGQSGAYTIDAFSEWDRSNGFNPIVFLGNDKSAVRYRYTLAHELGHIILHNKIPRDKLNRNSLKTIEDQANYFASEFLLESKSFLNSFSEPKLENFVHIKNKWKVSIGAMIMRAHNLEVIEDFEKTNLFKAYSKRGWRNTEPLDSDIKFERPNYLRRCIELLLEHNRITSRDIVELNYPIRDLEELINLPNDFIGKLIEGESARPQLKFVKF